MEKEKRGKALSRKTLLVFLMCSFSILLYAAGGASPSSLQSQGKKGIEVKGQIKDQAGNPVIGATVYYKGAPASGVAANVNGMFTIKCPDLKGILVISFVGFETQEIPLNGKTSFNVVLKDASKVLDEVMVVGYGQQKKVTSTGAVTGMKGDELLKSPTASLGNALAGKVTGVSSVQYTGEPGSDNPELFVRGIGSLSASSSTPLVLVDGVERNFFQLDPNEIESLSILKDASATAVFGVRGANGVIIVTTKRGQQGKAQVSISSSFGVQVPTQLLEFANSYQYAQYYNEALKRDGGDVSKSRFSPTVMEAFRTHSNPILYPDVDWMDYCLKDFTTQSQHNININGGIDRVRYFVSLGVTSQNGLFKTFDSSSESNYKYNRYNYRANLDFDLTKTTVMSVNIGGVVGEKNQPISGQSQDEIFRFLYRATPFAGPGIVNGKWIKTNPDYISNPGADGLDIYYGRGYQKRVDNDLNLDFQLDQKLDFVTSGLSLKVKGAYNNTYYQNKNRSASKPYYTPVLNADGSISYRKSGDEVDLGYGENFDKGRNWYAEAGLNWKRDFGDNHLSALLLYNQSKKYYPKTYTDIPSGYVGLVGRVTYDFKSKYLFDFNIGYNGSENFAPSKRYGVFPAVSVGWIASEEPFFKTQEVVNYLKFRGSYGVVGNDKIGDDRFLYLDDSYVLGGDSYNFGVNVTSNQPGAYEGKLGNKNVTWEKAVKQNYGVDMNLFSNRLKVSADFFRDDRSDILITRNTVPGYVAITLPAVNMGKVENKGCEFSVNWDDKIGKDFKYYIKGNLSYTKNKIVYSDEVPKDEAYMSRTGRSVDQPFGRVFWGFYDETAVARYEKEFKSQFPSHGITLQNGDCVYVDLNKDGVINQNDVKAIGYPNYPRFTAGLTLGFDYKDFNFSMNWAGATQVSRQLDELLRQPLGDIQNHGLLLSQYEDHWTEDTRNSATLPRATLSTGLSNNYAMSTLWLKDASYVRLKNVEMGYNITAAFVSKVKVKSLRVFVSGYNLLTFSKLKVLDPESRTNSRPTYPLMRVYNLGVKIGF
jgi:TonB-linked SusC/RagA family outer membrane protein